MSQLYWYHDKEKWQLHLDNLNTLVYLQSKESVKVTTQRRIESEFKCISRLVDYIKSGGHNAKKREHLFRSISRCFDIVSRMNEIQKENI